LHYQPKVDLRTGALIGVEALVRWQHDDHLIYPDKFIPYAEKTGLIRNLTKWVLNAALKQQSKWRSVGENLKMSVNLSFRDLDDHSLINYISESLDRWQVDPEDLVLEITETSVMEDPNRTMEVLRQLDEMGLGISIDDFGTGYSSLMYLKKLPVDEIKIDGRSCFVNNVIVSGDVTVTNSEDFAMIDSVVKGSVRVLGCRNAIVVNNDVGSFESAETVTNLLVSRNEHAWVMLNIVSNVLAVNLNSKADVKKNAAAILLCAGNRRLDSFENEAAEQNCQALGQ